MMTRGGFAVLCLLSAILMARAKADTDTLTQFNACTATLRSTDNTTTCATSSEIQQAISCVESTHIEPNDQRLAFLLSYREYVLNAATSKRDICPYAQNNGSCFKKEFSKCMNGYDGDNCMNVLGAKSCLLDLQLKCNSPAAFRKTDKVIFNKDCASILVNMGICTPKYLSSCVTSALTHNGHTTCTTETLAAAKHCMQERYWACCTYTHDDSMVQKYEKMVDQLCSPNQPPIQMIGR